MTVLGNQKHQLNTALKRKAPLMLGAATSGPSPVKVARDRSYQVQSVWFVLFVQLCTHIEHLEFTLAKATSDY